MGNPSHILLDRVTFLVGDVFARLAEIPDESFDCAVFSPPYWGLRDYGTGEWVGGDAACDHVKSEHPPVIGSSSTLGFPADGGPRRIAEGNTYHEAYTEHYREVCGKCGAKRVDAQIGLEPTLGEHLAVMVKVMREVRRVLKKTGTVWLNYGDCYATAPNGMSAAETKRRGKDDRTFRDKPFSTVGGTLKPKDLCMVPNRLAIELQNDGWWVRSEIIWAKPNPMPESVTDRPATAHEKIWLLTRSPRYYYDAEAVRVEGVGGPDRHRVFFNWANGPGPHDNKSHSRKSRDEQRAQAEIARAKKVAGWDREVTGKRHTSANAQARQIAERTDKQAETAKHIPGSRGERYAGFNERWKAGSKQRAADLAEPRHVGHINHTGIEDTPRGSRALRNYEPAPVQVWEIASRPFSEAHFATFPPELVERCLTAGCPPKTCGKCGTPWQAEYSRGVPPREVADSEIDRFGTGKAGTHRKIGQDYQEWMDANPLRRVGYGPACKCNADPIPGNVLDPFGGAGTTAMVAAYMGMTATVIELNSKYVALARKRLAAEVSRVEPQMASNRPQRRQPTDDFFGE